MDDFITGVTATIDAVAGRKHSRKRAGTATYPPSPPRPSSTLPPGGSART
ncbi:hypothetical protein ACTMTJ_38785 [Phytohabitans sp. LJ34]